MANVGSWTVAAAIRFSTNGPAIMSRLAATASVANAQLLRQRGAISAADLAMQKYKARIEEIRAAQMRLGTQLAAGGFMIGAAGLVYATNEAAKLERAMTGVQIATGASGKNLAALRGMVFNVSGQTAQSTVTIANEMSRAAQVAFKDPKQLMALFPMMAKYADVRYFASGGKQDPTDTVSQMSAYAHLFSAYGVDSMRKMLDLSAKLQFTTDTSLEQLVTQGRMYVPNATKLGVSMPELMQYTTIMSQLGFMKGRGGTALNNLILGAEGAVSPTATLSKARTKGLRDLGVYDSLGRFKFVDEQGHLQLDKMVRHLQAMRELFERENARTGGGRWMTDIGAAFGKEAQRLVSVLADAQTRGQMDRNVKAFQRIPGVDGQWSKYMEDFLPQWNVFTTNLKNVFIAIGLPMLPKLTGFLKDLNDQLGPLVAYLAANPDLGKRIFEIATVLTVSFGVRALAGAIIGLNSLRTSIDLLGKAAAVNAVIVGGSTAAGAAGGAATGAGGGGLLGKVAGFFGRGLSALDGILLGGLGGKLLGAMRGLSGGLVKAVGKGFEATPAIFRGLIAMFFRGFQRAAASFGPAFEQALYKDLALGLKGALKILTTPLRAIGDVIGRLAGAVVGRIPSMIPLLDGLGEVLLRFASVLLNIAKFIPFVDVAAMVLTTQSHGESQADEDAYIRANSARIGKRPGVTINGPVTFQVMHKDPDAAQKQFEWFIQTQNAGTLGSRSGRAHTAPFLPNPATVPAR